MGEPFASSAADVKTARGGRNSMRLKKRTLVLLGVMVVAVAG